MDELDTYVREKSEEEMGIVTEVSDDVRTVMERLQSVSTLFDEALRRGCEKPFEGFEEGALLRGVQEAKEEYKAGRTRYSDTMINYKSGLSSPVRLYFFFFGVSARMVSERFCINMD